MERAPMSGCEHRHAEGWFLKTIVSDLDFDCGEYVERRDGVLQGA